MAPLATCLLAGLLVCLPLVNAAAQSAPCDKSRKVFTEPWGIVTDGPTGFNYTQDSHCEWLIKANNSQQFITLSFRAMGTECSYDYVFVYDGSSFNSPLLGSFSGKTEPQQVTAVSGSMLILLYSDTNYVLDGFRAEFSVTDCPRNCSGHGLCVRHACVCEGDWGGKDCGVELCPDECGYALGRGICRAGRCECAANYTGRACSLHRDDPEGNRWHLLSHSEGGFTARAAHSAVYLRETDSLYVFGGFDLNNVLGDLVVYQFKLSQWEDESGKQIEGAASWSAPLDAHTLADVLEQVGQSGEERWGLRPKSSFLRNLLFSVADNATLKVKHRTAQEKGQHLARIPRQALISGTGEQFSTETSQSAVTEIPSDSTEVSEIPPDSDVNEADPADPMHDGESSTSVPPKLPHPKRPAPRYGHAACRCAEGMALYGGKLSDGSLSDELWLYNVNTKSWLLRAIHSKVRPPKLTRHTLTLAGDYLYLFGGSTAGGDFSSRLYRIKIALGEKGADHEQWELVHPRGGKELDVRVVAHSTVYHPASNSLLVYGGVVAGVKRFSKLSDRMFAFQLDARHWSELHYPRAHLPETYVPRERAFHTSTIIGNYLVVFGGYSHRHNKEEICYDSQLYLYHLGCHTWVNHEVLGTHHPASRYPKQQGVFAHAAAVRNGNTLLVVGGYHGNVNADLLAYTLPPMLASREGESYEPDQVCGRHHVRVECTANPECGWCSADDVCYGRTVGVNCTTNLQTTRCLGVCPALGDCHSCLIHGSAPTASAAFKLRLGQCTWCVQNARCHHKDDNYGVCGLGEDTPSEAPGWWGPKGTEVTRVEECRVLDRRPGLTFVQYKHPANWSQPDSVSIINATTADFSSGTGWSRSEPIGGITARLRGSLHPPDWWKDSHETLRMCVSHSSATLQVAHLNASDLPQHAHLEIVGNLSAEQSACVSATWEPGKPVLLHDGVFLVDFESRKTVGVDMHHQSKMELQHNRSQESAKVFTFEYLAPYENGSCWQYSNCLACLTDSACGWCEITAQCLDRHLDETEACRKQGEEAGPDEWHYLTLQPATCPNCSNYISCDACVSSGLCEWWTDDARCARRGRASDAVLDVNKCPAPCHERGNCSQCLEERGVCVWCEATQECFSFSVYTSEYQFGLCREWLDQTYHGVTTGPSNGVAVPPGEGAQQCKSCMRHLNCSSCVHTLGCGWCHSTENPIQGICVQGDFDQPHDEPCSAVLMSDEDVVNWAYAQCPDVDECDLGLDDCHPDAICTNTHGSYSCQCKRGFNGDGRTTCTKTCFYNCVHGYCVGAPDYSCRCDLGWTGLDCNTNCLCNNHSTCSQGVGKCDQCQDWTTGEYCQYCRAGSYGNATSGQGCHGCNCNEHGSEALGVCDFQTGVCFCQDNTVGDNCDKCKTDFYGDPRNGGLCYYQCMARGVLAGFESQGLGSRSAVANQWEPRFGGPPSSECLWIISPFHMNNRSDNPPSIIQLTVHEDIRIPCDENSVYIYDGLPDFVSTNPTHQSHVLGMFCGDDSVYPYIVEATTGIMTIHYKQLDLNDGFNASYVIFVCPDHCPANRTCLNGHCVCPEGWSGPHCAEPLCPNNCSAELKQGICDKSYWRCLCNPDWGGPDCSVSLLPSHLVSTELFNSAHLSEASSLAHWRKMLPRFGHSLSADRRGALWMFGGFSLSHGPLNDIRLFDTKNATWMQITVDSTSDAKMPKGRYYHAAEIVQSRREIYIYGGLGARGDSTKATFNDTWKFVLKSQRWIHVQSEIGPPPLAGHTLTLLKSGDVETLILIGGLSPLVGFSEFVWEFNLETENWSRFNTTGDRPLGIFGHSTVFHGPSQSFYVFGGYNYLVNRTLLSNKLYSLHYPTRVWSMLPPFENYNPPDLHLPRARAFHTAVTKDDYMLIFGGRSHPHNMTDTLVAYLYTCNQWVRLISKDVNLVGVVPPSTYAHAMAMDPESGAIFVVGGFEGGVESHVTHLSLPDDLCALWPGKCHLPGCSYCAVIRSGGAPNSTFCYNNARSMPDECSSGNGTVRTTNGVSCNRKWISARNCSQHKACSECLASWPSHIEEGQTCKWCKGIGSGSCVDIHSDECGKSELQTTLDVSECPEKYCYAPECDLCRTLDTCIWTRPVLRGERGIEPSFDWGCTKKTILDRITYPYCPKRCGEHRLCDSCLRSHGAEGGYRECRWSTAIHECVSPAYQSLLCSGGVCGMVISGGNTERCPEPCSTYFKCSDCLRHARCGWCSLDSGNQTGRGVCTEGSLERPASGPLRSTCAALFQEELKKNHHPPLIHSYKNGTETIEIPKVFSWHYVKCPPENECENTHHSCNPVSEVCEDLTVGFHCKCGPGYRADRAERKSCVPVCSQGCVRGLCIEPNRCLCDFGYVGANCSIQCQCNGHSNCAGPDKLDFCLSCRNNTMGRQCERCKPLFVGDPSNNGQCVPCIDYCNGHTHICINDSISAPPSGKWLDVPLEDLKAFLGEGPTTHAHCIGCANRTTGDKCDECISGNFRGSEDHRDPCRPCQCHGHGHLCDPVTGEKCNCQNNTESDCPSVQSLSQKSSNVDNECWRNQCSKCRESYMGKPTDGHQCYKQMSVDLKFCLDAKLIDECKLKPRPLMPGQTVFFAVQPRFMNVDIRVIVDVTEGALDLYLSPREDTYVVHVNERTGEHIIDMDHKYIWRPEEYDTLTGGVVVSAVELVQPEPLVGDNSSVHASHLQSLQSLHLSPGDRDRDRERERERDRGRYSDRDHGRHDRHDRHSERLHSFLGHKFIRQERHAHGLTSFVTVNHKNTLLVVRNLRDRLVLTLPQDRHELGVTRFFIALAARNTSGPTLGMIFFRQDQLHIDLFVFFSVFFSCFFLFLAACVVGWKAKQAADIRRARRRHVVEMLHMAKRPFASATVLLEGPDRTPAYCPSGVQGQGQGQGPQAASQSQGAAGSSGSGQAAAQASASGFSAAQLVPSPARKKQHQHRTGGGAAGSASQTRSPAGSAGSRLNSGVLPVAVELTDDGVAAVATVLVRLPGGRDAPVRMALASSLILLARVYPTNGRAFLRRRSGHSHAHSHTHAPS
ncbi:multiple epidermal growth factor-like domains protein 8 [Thrips palmi]|uniref:Multiple epidermal growth factor-like domains protein 8 n=1 Tax=Thrips palmi TaxID=161013 RepID=A0A6P8YRN2_THRPL|nr:multiple epidermal growth factor-like domains protein 8 [Thrips palmi]